MNDFKYYVSTEFSETAPGDYRLNTLLAVGDGCVVVCDPMCQSVTKVALSGNIKKDIDKKYILITQDFFVKRFFNLLHMDNPLTSSTNQANDEK